MYVEDETVYTLVIELETPPLTESNLPFFLSRRITYEETAYLEREIQKFLKDKKGDWEIPMLKQVVENSA